MNLLKHRDLMLLVWISKNKNWFRSYTVSIIEFQGESTFLITKNYILAFNGEIYNFK